MAINQILSVPDWRKLSTFTGSTPPGGFSQIYPGPNQYWYVQESSGLVKRLAYDNQFYNGLTTVFAPTESFVDKRIDVSISSGLSFSYDGPGSSIFVTGLTTGNLSIIGSFTQGYVLSAATSGDFEWIAAGSASVQGTSGSVAKFTSSSSVGDSGMIEVISGTPGDPRASLYVGMNFPTNLGGNGSTKATVAFGVSPSIYVDRNIHFGDNSNRYIGLTNSTDIEISTTGDFLVSAHPLLPGTDSKAKFIDAQTDFSTHSSIGHDRHIEFLSGLVSVNQRSNYPPLFIEPTSTNSTGVTPSSLIRTPSFGFTSGAPFLNYLTGTFGVALGLSGGGIQIKDGTEGQYRVLVSSTTQGHGIWATMVEPGPRWRLPLYQSNGNFALGASQSWRDSYNYPFSGGTPIVRTFSTSIELALQNWTFYVTASSNYDVNLAIPNMGGPTATFLMSRNQKDIFGPVYLYDEVETFGSKDTIGKVDSFDRYSGFNRTPIGTVPGLYYLRDEGIPSALLNSGLFFKDISNTGVNPNGLFTYGKNRRNNYISYGLGPEKTAGGAWNNRNQQLISAWHKPNGSVANIHRPSTWTMSYFVGAVNVGAGAGGVLTWSLPDGASGSGARNAFMFGDSLSYLAFSGYNYFPRAVVQDSILFYQNTTQSFPYRSLADVGDGDKNLSWGQPDAWVGGSGPNSVRQISNPAYTGPGYGHDMYLGRAKSTILGQDFMNDRAMNFLMDYQNSRLIHTGSYTEFDTILHKMIKGESGEYNANLTQSTGLFVVNQIGSWQDSGAFVTASRLVGIQVAQALGIQYRKPNAWAREAYDFYSSRIANGNIESNIESHVGFFAQSKLNGQMWDPMGRRIFAYGARPVYRNPADLNIGGLGPISWPTYSIYNTNKPWGFFAEKDKSNLGGGLLIDMGATFGTPLRASIEIEAVTRSRSFGTLPFTVSSTVSVFQRDGSYITYPFAGVSYSTFSSTLPQLLLRPGVTPSQIPDGSLWYTPGNLSFVDSGITYNLLTTNTTTVFATGLTGFGVNNYVPVWNGVSSLKATSSIYISNSGNGNVGIGVIVPDYSLQVATTSLSPTIALGLSGSILYQDGSQGAAGSVMVADSTGKLSLFALPKSNQVVFGNAAGTSLTSSVNFQFINVNSVTASAIVAGRSNTILDPTIDSIVVGGFCNRLGVFGTTSMTHCISNSSIIGGCCNTVGGTCSSFANIIGGRCNTIQNFNFRNSIFGSDLSTITGDGICVLRSVIVGGAQNLICKGNESTIIGGGCNTIWHCMAGLNGTYKSTILGGCCNSINTYTNQSSIVGGFGNSITNRHCNSIVLGGVNNTICASTWGGDLGGNNNAILGGATNSIESWKSGFGAFGNYGNCSSIIIGGNFNKIGCNLAANNTCPGVVRSTILGGQQNFMFCNTSNSNIIGGQLSTIIDSTNSAIIGASGGSMSNSHNSVIIGGQNLCLSSTNNMVYVPSLMISTVSNDPSATCFLVWDFDTKQIRGSTGGPGGGGSGSQGPRGFQGAAGTNGSQGAVGSQGTTGSQGRTGATGIASVGPFSANNFYPFGATLSSGILTLGAAGTAGPGLVHTSTQTFSGDKYFNGDVFVGPTNTNGLFLFDGSGITYSGFIGPTRSSSNLIYRLPPVATVGRYLKIDNQSGDVYELSWATAAGGGPGGLLPATEIGFGDGSAIVSSANFRFWSTGLNLLAAESSNLQAPTSNFCNNVIIGGKGHTMSNVCQSIILGGLESNMVGGDGGDSANSIIGSYRSCITGTGSRSSIIGGYRNFIIATGPGNGAGTNTIIGGGCNTVTTGGGLAVLRNGLFSTNNSTVRNNTSNSVILGGDSHLIGDCSSCSAILSGLDSGVYFGCASSIVGGQKNRICNDIQSSIIGGYGGGICGQSDRSSIIGGCNNQICNAPCSLITTSRLSCINPGPSTNATINSGIILGGDNNIISGSNSDFATIINGNNQCILGTNSNNSSILGGLSNKILTFSEASTIIGGNDNTIRNAPCSAIISSKSSKVCLNANATSTQTIKSNIIIGGDNNLIFGTSSEFATIINGNNQCIFGCGSNNSGIIGGSGNLIGTASNNSFIVGGQNNRLLTSPRSVIIGGDSLSLTGFSDTVLVPNLQINSVIQDDNQTALLVWNGTDKIVRWRHVDTISGGPGGGSTVSLAGFVNGTLNGTIDLLTGGFTNGATLSYNSNKIGSLTFSAANSVNPGMVSTSTQSFKGVKTFMDDVFIGSTATNTQEGLYFYDTNTYSTTYKHTGFVAPNGNYWNRVLGNTGRGPTWSLVNDFVYELPGLTGRSNQFLTIASFSTSTGSTTYSLTWTYPQVGVGLTLSDTGVIGLVNLTPNTVINVTTNVTNLNTYTVSTGDNGKLIDVRTDNQVIYVVAPTATQSYYDSNLSDRGFEFRVRKNDTGNGVVSVNLPEVGGTANSPSGFPFVHLTRQNQIYEFKYNYASQSWASYLVDMGYVGPNTLIGNLTTATGYAEEYEFVDYNDSVQKALNYTEGSFNNDWLNGVIYSSVDALNVSTSLLNNQLSLFNINSGQFVGLSPAGASGLTIPGFSLTRGKNLRVYLAGTYSKTESPAGGLAQFNLGFLLGGKTINSRTFSNDPVAPNTQARGYFEIEYNLKVRNGGLSGSVYGTGKMMFEDLSSAASPVYLLHNNYTQSLVTDINLASNATFDIRVNNPSATNLSFTVLNSIIERLA